MMIIHEEWTVDSFSPYGGYTPQVTCMRSLYYFICHKHIGKTLVWDAYCYAEQNIWLRGRLLLHTAPYLLPPPHCRNAATNFKRTHFPSACLRLRNFYLLPTSLPTYRHRASTTAPAVSAVRSKRIAERTLPARIFAGANNSLRAALPLRLRLFILITGGRRPRARLPNTSRLCARSHSG